MNVVVLVLLDGPNTSQGLPCPEAPSKHVAVTETFVNVGMPPGVVKLNYPEMVQLYVELFMGLKLAGLVSE